jgi:hypothetical protein
MIAAFVFAGAVLQAVSPSPAPLASPIPTATASATASASATPPPLRRIGSAIVAIPSSWHAEKPRTFAGVAAVLGKWNDGTPGGEWIALSVSPSTGLDARSFAGRVRDVSLRGLSLVSSAPLPLCRGTRGWKELYRGSDGSGYTFVYAVTPTRAYIATYAYPGYPGPSAEGEAAAETLCAPTDPVVHVGPPPIEPPSGWHPETPAIFTEAGHLPTTTWLWYPRSDGNRDQSIGVMSFPMPSRGGLSFGITYWLEGLYGGREHATVLQRSPMPLCQTLDGMYVVVRGTRVHTPTEVEAVMTLLNKVAYVATYTRALSLPKRPEAERAIRSLCPSAARRSSP